MTEAAHASPRAIRQLVLLAVVISAGYLCTQTMRFTNEGANLAFFLALLVVPFLAINPVSRLSGWPKLLTTIVLVPALAISLLGLVFTASCEVPALALHQRLARELGSIQQGNYSVHLTWRETAGGAVGPHGVALEQRMPIAPGLYVLRELDYFEGAHEGSISGIGADRFRLHIPASNSNQAVDKVYSLKRRVYF